MTRPNIAQIRAELSAKGTVIRRMSPIEKAQANPRSPTLAIRGKCWECAGSGADGTQVTKATIGGCQITQCPLWNLRPFQSKQPTNEEE
jgi:hypothetical protein